MPVVTTPDDTGRRGAAVTAGLPELDAILALQRELLDDLTFALESESALVHSGMREQSLRRAATEVSTASGRLRDAELLRSVYTEQAAADLGLDPAPTLAEIAARTGEPWRGRLLQRRAQLRAAADDVSTVSTDRVPDDRVD